MKIAIYGVGGVGGYFGGRLAQSGEQVTFIARGAHLGALQAQGLQVDSIKGDFRIFPVQATDDPAQVGEVEAVILGVKSWQVPEAAQSIRPLLGPQTCVLPLQNGVEATTQLEQALGREHVLGGLCQIVSQIAGPGHIIHSGIDPYLALGELDNRLTPRLQRLHQAFVKAGVRAEIPADIQAAIWNKFLFIAAISGVGAVARAPAGILRSVPGTRRLLEAAMQEIETVAQAHQVHLPPGAVENTMRFIDGLPENASASMQRDILNGRPSELESQNGAVVRLGQEKGVETPVHGFIYASLLPSELHARQEIQFSLPR